MGKFAGWRRPCGLGLRAEGAMHAKIADPEGLRQARRPWVLAKG
jgi:hypothetical protein